jgi:hypothetical protein
VSNGFQNYLTDFVDILNSDRLDFGEGHRQYFVAKIEKGSITSYDEARTGKRCFVVVITTKITKRNKIVTHLSVHFESSECVCFTENNI